MSLQQKLHVGQYLFQSKHKKFSGTFYRKTVALEESWGQSRKKNQKTGFPIYSLRLSEYPVWEDPLYVKEQSGWVPELEDHVFSSWYYAAKALI